MIHILHEGNVSRKQFTIHDMLQGQKSWKRWIWCKYVISDDFCHFPTQNIHLLRNCEEVLPKMFLRQYCEKQICLLQPTLICWMNVLIDYCIFNFFFASASTEVGWDTDGSSLGGWVLGDTLPGLSYCASLIFVSGITRWTDGKTFAEN